MGQLLSKKQQTKILILGLDAAGKTTLLYRWKLGEVVTTIPSIGFNIETINHSSVSITAWDLGGRCKMRPLLRHYYPNSDGVIYVIDSTDRERLDEVKDEIKSFAMEDDLIDIPVVLMANKQDLKGALTSLQLAEQLDLNKLLHKQPWAILETSATEGKGVEETLALLSSMISRVRAKAIGRGALGLTKDDLDKQTSEVVDEGGRGTCFQLMSSALGYEHVKGTIKKFISWF